MDAQHMEAKLLEEANAAWEAYYAEKDPARSDKLEKRWNKAQDALERFRGQQVAGGGSEDRVAQLGSEVARLGYELQQVKIASNRAANSSQREAYIGKVRRAQVKTSSFPDELPNVPAASMRAVVKRLQDFWDPLPAERSTKKRRGASRGAQQQALPPVAAPAEREAPLRHITMQYKGNDDLREAKHMQPAALQLLTEMQQALGSGTGLVLADTHASSYLQQPTKKIDCSGLAGNDCLWSQLVVPIEFKLDSADGDAALRQLVETASIVQRQQPERAFIYAVSITMDTVEVFCLCFGRLADFSGICSSGPLPVRLQQDSAGLCMLARVLAAPLAQLGFVSAHLPEGRLESHRFKCTARLALRTVSTSTPSRQNSYVFKAKLTEQGDRQAVLKLAFNDKEARILQLLPRSANLVRLLAAGQFHYSRALWQAVLVEPVVKQLEASLPVQQIAQVTFDIAHAVEELAKLMIVHRDISPNNIGYQDDGHGCHGWLYDFGAAKVVESWSDTDTDPSTLVQNLTGTPMYMAIDVLRGSRHSPSTEVESLFYTILAVCTDGRLSDRGANSAEDPRTAAKLRRGGMTESELEELQHAPQDKHDFLKTLHDLFFPWGQERNEIPAQRVYRNNVSPAAVKTACKEFITPSL